MDRNQRIVQIILEDAVGAIQRAVDVRVDDEIIATDIIRCAGTWLYELSPLLGDEKRLLANGQRIPLSVDLRDHILLVRNDLEWNMTGSFQDFLCKGEMEAFLFDIDLFGEIGIIHSDLGMISTETLSSPAKPIGRV
jgi:hypothetical protein